MGLFLSNPYRRDAVRTSQSEYCPLPAVYCGRDRSTTAGRKWLVILFSTNARAVLNCAEVCPYLSLPRTPGGECLIGSLATLDARLTSEDPVGIWGFRGKGYREASASLPTLRAVPHPRPKLGYRAFDFHVRVSQGRLRSGVD